jgi:folate-binding protein YgfZ
MFPLTALSVIEFSGPDTGQFLHNQLSADIQGISEGEATFACCCNPAGRVISLMLVTRQEDLILVVCSAELADPLVTWLSRYIIRAEVKICRRDELLVMAATDDVSEGTQIMVPTITGLNYCLLKKGETNPGLSPESEHQWKQEEFAKGIVWLGNETSAKFLPQMLGFEKIQALSFKKGCFPGQEIIARTRYLGKLKRRPLLIPTKATPETTIGEKLSLINQGDSSSAVLVDQSVTSDGKRMLFVVARSEEEFLPEKVTAQDGEIVVL